MNTRIQLQAGRSSFQSLAILFGLALLSFSIFAAPPNAPVFTALDDQELDPPSPDGRYSLDDATRGLPFTVDTPIPPRIVAEQIVTPSTLGNHINTSGMRLILEPGNYGNLSIGGTDKEIVFTTGVVINHLNVNGQRIIVKANPARTGTINYWNIQGGAEDILFDGIYTESAATSGYEENTLGGGGHRIAIINSRMRTNNFVLVAFPDAGGLTDLIVGNNYLESYGGTQAAVRLQSVQRLAFVDNFLWSSGGNATFRLHASDGSVKADNLYVGRNQFEGPNWQIRPLALGTNDRNNTAGMGSVWVENNNVYFDGLWWINMGSTANDVDHPEVFTQRNNNAYISSGSWKADDYGTAWTYSSSNNSVQGYTAPPVWEHQ